MLVCRHQLALKHNRKDNGSMHSHFLVCIANIIIIVTVSEETLKDDPALVQKVQTYLAEGNSDVVAYAAQLGDGNVIREYLNTAPNEV